MRDVDPEDSLRAAVQREDAWAFVRDGVLLGWITDQFAASYRDRGLAAVAAIEARGFVLGGALADRLRVGFVPIRRGEGYLPGRMLAAEADPDWQGERHRLKVQVGAIEHGGRIVVVDDWVETGSQALAAKGLIERAGGVFVALAAVVDELDEDSSVSTSGESAIELKH